MGDTVCIGWSNTSVSIDEQELLLIIVAMFLIEALSVILQTTYYKYSRYKTGEGKEYLNVHRYISF